MSLVTRLQMRIKQLEWEKTVMQRDIDRKEARLENEEARRGSVDSRASGPGSAGDIDKDVYESIKVSRLSR